MTKSHPRASGHDEHPIPLAWVEAAPVPPAPARAALQESAPPALKSVIASAPPAVLDLFTPATQYFERSECVIEPGRPCRGSGQCRQRGY